MCLRPPLLPSTVAAVPKHEKTKAEHPPPPRGPQYTHSCHTNQLDIMPDRVTAAQSHATSADDLLQLDDSDRSEIVPCGRSHSLGHELSFHDTAITPSSPRSALAFPTLNNDGSLEDLTTLSSPPLSPTPPAALSSVGARVRMAANMSGSFVDEQYDMIDDLSEISNDDHDTASISSTDHDPGHSSIPATPNYESEVEDPLASSIVSDVAETGSEHLHPFILPPPSQNDQLTRLARLDASERQTKVENDLIDSYTSDTLETPRQSAIATGFASTIEQAHSKACTEACPTDELPRMPSVRQLPHSILFVSRPGIAVEHMDTTCSRVAAGLDGDCSELSTHRVARLPAPPSDADKSSSTVVWYDGGVSATIMYSDDVRRSHSGKVDLLQHGESIGNQHETGSRDFNSEDADFCILYLGEEGRWTDSWPVTMYDTLRSMHIPVLVVHGPGVHGSIVPAPSSSQFYMSNFSDTSSLGKLSHSVQVLKDTYNCKTTLRSGITEAKKLLAVEKSTTSINRVSQIIFAFTTVLALLIGSQYRFSPWDSQAVLTSSDHLAAITSARRSALLLALQKVPDHDGKLASYDVDHLLTYPSDNCTSHVLIWHEDRHSSCVSRDQQWEPLCKNEILVSFAGYHHFPEVESLKVARNDGAKVAFNITKLVDGVYYITLDSQDMGRSTRLELATKDDVWNLQHSDTSSHVEHLGEEVGKSLAENLSSMWQTAKNLKEMLSSELEAGVRATKNISTRAASRELMAFAHTAASVVNKAATAGNRTASAITNDVILLQKDLARMTKGLSIKIKDNLDVWRANSLSHVKKPLEESRNRLFRLKEAFHKAQSQRKESTQKVEQSILADVVRQTARLYPKVRPPVTKDNSNADDCFEVLEHEREALHELKIANGVLHYDGPKGKLPLKYKWKYLRKVRKQKRLVKQAKREAKWCRQQWIDNIRKKRSS